MQLQEIKNEKFIFLSGDKLLLLTWKESDNVPPKIDVISKFDIFPMN